MNIDYTNELISNYKTKQDDIKLNPVKFSHTLICGTMGSIVSICMVKEPSLDLMIFSGIGGYVLGALVPYIVKKIRIADLDYQIFINKSIINDLNAEKTNILQKKL